MCYLLYVPSSFRGYSKWQAFSEIVPGIRYFTTSAKVRVGLGAAWCWLDFTPEFFCDTLLQSAISEPRHAIVHHTLRRT